MNYLTFKLSEIADFRNGYSFSSRDLTETQTRTSLPVFKMGNVQIGGGFRTNTKHFFDIEKDLKVLKNQIKEGDILMCMTDMKDNVRILGHSAYASSQIAGWLVNQRVGQIRANIKIVDSRFLYYLLNSKSYIDALRITARSGVQVNLSSEDIKNLEIDLPPLSLQQRIAEILGALDDKIELNRQMNHTLEQMAQALYKYYFVDDIDPENLPEGWKSSKIKEFGLIVCGKTPSKKVSKYFVGDIPFIKIPDMHQNTFILKTEDSLTKEGADSQRTKYIPAESICVSCIATVGLVGITTSLSQTNQQINTIVPSYKCDKYYLYFVMRGLRKDLQDLGSGGTATLNVNTSLFSDYEIANPVHSFKELFHNKVEPLFNKILNNSIEIESLATTRDILLPKLISGEITPSDLQTIEQAI